jgi:hypothetical protein
MIVENGNENPPDTTGKIGGRVQHCPDPFSEEAVEATVEEPINSKNIGLGVNRITNSKSLKQKQTKKFSRSFGSEFTASHKNNLFSFVMNEPAFSKFEYFVTVRLWKCPAPVHCEDFAMECQCPAGANHVLAMD